MLSVGTVLAAVALGAASELILRWIPPAALRATGAGSPHVYSETYGWELRRSFRYRGRRGETVAVNRQGYRGREPEAAPASARRVVLLGDSVTFGTGVSDGATFADLLDRAGLHAVNLGVEGYGTDQELIRLEVEGAAHRPDEVVLGFCLRNDFFDNGRATSLYDGVSPKPYFTLEADRLVPHDDHLRLGRAARLAVRLNERSYLVNALGLVAGGRVAASPGKEDEWAHRREELRGELPRLAALTHRLLERMARVSERLGARLTIAVHADRRSFEGDHALLDLLDPPPNVRVIDLAQEYRRRGMDYERLTIDGIGHLSPSGHRAVAEILRAALAAPAPDRPAAAR